MFLYAIYNFLLFYCIMSNIFYEELWNIKIRFACFILQTQLAVWNNNVGVFL